MRTNTALTHGMIQKYDNYSYLMQESIQEMQSQDALILMNAQIKPEGYKSIIEEGMN